MRAKAAPLRPVRAKFGNIKADGFDSRKERDFARTLDQRRRAAARTERVVGVERQVAYQLVPTQRDGMGRLLEKMVQYKADFRVTYADGHIEVIDVKGPATRTLPSYVIKRKLMLHVHGVRVLEV